MDTHQFQLIRSELQDDIEWSVRYLSIYDISSTMALSLVDRIILDISKSLNNTNSRTLRDYFLNKLQYFINTLKT